MADPIKPEAEEINYEITIGDNVVTDHADIDGGALILAVVLGMLDWAKRELLRTDAENRLAERMRNMPSVLVPRGPLR